MWPSEPGGGRVVCGKNRNESFCFLFECGSGPNAVFLPSCLRYIPLISLIFGLRRSYRGNRAFQGLQDDKARTRSLVDHRVRAGRGSTIPLIVSDELVLRTVILAVVISSYALRILPHILGGLTISLQVSNPLSD